MTAKVVDMAGVAKAVAAEVMAAVAMAAIAGGYVVAGQAAGGGEREGCHQTCPRMSPSVQVASLICP